MERLCNDYLERGKVSLKAFSLACDNNSRIMINKGALAEYSQKEMLVGSHPRDFIVNAVLQLELDPRDPSTFTYNKLRKDVLNECATTDALAVLDSEGAGMAPAVSPYPPPAEGPLPQMPVVVDLPAIPS